MSVKKSIGMIDPEQNNEHFSSDQEGRSTMDRMLGVGKDQAFEEM